MIPYSDVIAKPEAEAFFETCFKRQVEPIVILQPARHRDDASAAKRRGVLTELNRNGWTVKMLAQICPMSLRSIQLTLKQSPR